MQLGACNKADATNILVGLDRWVRSHGEMKEVITDGGKHFVNNEVRRMLRRMGVRHTIAIAYDHCSSVIVERCNKIVLQMIKKNMCANLRLRWWQMLGGIEV